MFYWKFCLVIKENVEKIVGVYRMKENEDKEKEKKKGTDKN